MSGGLQPPDPRGTRDAAAPRRGRWSWIGGGAVAAVRGLGLCGLMAAGAVLVLFLATAAVFAALGYGLYVVVGWRRLAIAAAVVVPLLGAGLAVLHKGALSIPVVVVLAGLAVSLPLVPAALVAVRRLAILTRRLSGEWCEVPIADPYRPPPGGESLSFRGRLGWLLGDPASWRDLLWLAVSACVGWIMTAAPASLVVTGVIWAFKDTVLQPVPVAPPAFASNSPFLLFLIGAGCVALGLWAARWLLRGYGMLARSLLGPTGQAELALRVAHLAQTRAEAIDTGAAEMRRIERDLHDGAQARLVAMGMTLDAAGQLMEGNPAAARALLAEARESSAKALAELRALVRGIHPPVLAVSVWPSSAGPEITGAVVLCGGAPSITGVGCEVLDAEPRELVAVTVTRSVLPRSASTAP